MPPRRSRNAGHKPAPILGRRGIGLRLRLGLAGVGNAGSASRGLASEITSLNAQEVRLSQRTVSYSKVDRATGNVYTYDDLVSSMRQNGWRGDPVDVARMPDGKLTSMDNTRITAAREAGIEVQATVRDYSDRLTAQMQEARGWERYNTWGEALTARIQAQGAKFSTATRMAQPNHRVLPGDHNEAVSFQRPHSSGRLQLSAKVRRVSSS